MSENAPNTDISDLTKTVLSILSDWKLDAVEQIAVLGLPENTKPRALTRMSTHGTTVVQDDFIERAKLILAIRNAVDSLYPHNGQAAAMWITTANYFFSAATPVEVMVAHGIEGMERVLNHLNGTGDW